MQLINHTNLILFTMNIFLPLNTVRCIFDAAGLRIWDVEKIFTHGGSLRVFGCHADDARKISR